MITAHHFGDAPAPRCGRATECSSSVTPCLAPARFHDTSKTKNRLFMDEKSRPISA
jgi:hypothetical protein